MNIGLIPLDERPVNTRYPAMIAAIAGTRVVLPPPGMLSTLRRRADCDALGVWLAEIAPTLDGLIVSCEMLGYGSLITSRTSHEPASTILARLDALREVKRQHPRLPIYGFSLITRVSNSNDPTEEAPYWASDGKRLYQFSQLLDRQQQGQPVDDEQAALLAALPEQHRHDFLRRRLRNHTVNMAAMQLLADEVLDLLVLSSDDTSPFGLPSREKRWLASWADLLGLGERLLMYPGADEVGCALLAWLLNRRAGVTPRFGVAYAPPEAAENVAAYEDGPIRVTVERQVRAVGGQLVARDANIWLAVNAPVARRSEWDAAHAEQERAERWPALQSLVGNVQQWQARGAEVAVLDVAYPNGADPALIALLQHVDLRALAAYGAWNTAGNTIGTALAQACAAQFIQDAEQRAAHERFLLHRFLEDWGYQHVVRAETRAWLHATYGSDEIDAELLPATRARIAQQLGALIDGLPGFAGRYRLVPDSVRLPWGRLFEVDFDLELAEA